MTLGAPGARILGEEADCACLGGGVLADFVLPALEPALEPALLGITLAGLEPALLGDADAAMLPSITP